MKLCLKLAWTSAVAGCLVVFAASAPGAQTYSIDWWTIDGGGGTSSGGNFALTGTIGQPDASPTVSVGGQFSLVGGFWAMPVLVQATNGPTLLIAPATPGFATISWTPATPGFVLQYSLRLDVPDWQDAPSGAQNPAIVPATVPVRFYRLLSRP